MDGTTKFLSEVFNIDKGKIKLRRLPEVDAEFYKKLAANLKNKDVSKSGTSIIF